MGARKGLLACGGGSRKALFYAGSGWPLSGSQRRAMIARAQSELGSENLLQLVLDMIPHEVFWKDRESRFLGGNRHFMKCLGATCAADFMGRTDLDYFPLEEAEAFRADDESVMQSRMPKMHILEPRTGAGGHLRWLDTCKVPMINSDGVVIGLFGFAEDVTDRRKLEETARQSAKYEAIARLSSGVAHDFNNLLMLVVNTANLARKEVAPESTTRRYLDDLMAATDRAASLTRQLLTFGREQSLAPRTISMSAHVQDMQRLLARLVGDECTLTVENDATPVYTHVDPSKFDQVLLNLVLNAREARPDGGEIVIRTEGAGEHSVLVVRDRGVGMSDEVRERAFEPFFTTKETGNGLGLATVLGIVRQSGGHVDVHSQVNLGSEFRVVLPAVHP